MKADYSFHVHDTIEDLRTQHFYDIPIAWSSGAGTEVYIMQEDRIVYIGTKQGAINFMRVREGVFVPLHPMVKRRLSDVDQ